MRISDWSSDVCSSDLDERRNSEIGRVEMRDDRGIGAEPLRGAAAHKDIVILVGRVALRLSNAGEHEPFGAPLARIAARPAREAKPVRDAKGLELLEAAPCDLVRH